ncbi:MAG: G/U mismatch-specific DNA glycosylase [Candidatus Krumholzibacteriales bacterium]
MNRTNNQRKPDSSQIESARGKKVSDIIRKGLDILFCGINPGLYSAAVGHHFARPGNRFWKALHKSGLTSGLLEPWEEEELLKEGFGITNLVNRASARASELEREELIEGRKVLQSKVSKFQPSRVVILGITAYRTAFERRKAGIGKQKEKIEGSELWVLPNPSGINAHYQLSDFVRLFRNLR